MAAITLDISSLDRPAWHDCSHCNFKPGDNIDIWLIEVAKNLHFLKSFAALLNKEELARANRYLRKEDHNRFIISRVSLRYILSKYIGKQPQEIVFELEPNRKPYINGAGIQYNLSDSNNQVLIAISGQPVGIDVEYIKPKFYYDTILPLNFSIPEIDFINEQDSPNRFFKLWTRKEAILKATGIGLTDHLKQIPSLDGQYAIDGGLISTRNNWRLSSFMSSEDYMATIASGPLVTTYNFYEFNYEEFAI